MGTCIAVTQSSDVDIFTAYNRSTNNFLERICCISAAGPGYRFCRNCITESDRFLPLPQKTGFIIEDSISCYDNVTKLFCFSIKSHVQSQYLTGNYFNTGYSLFLIGYVAKDEGVSPFLNASDGVFSVNIG